MAFPSVYTAFTYPTANDRLNNPSHSALHNTVASALGQVEAVIGLNGGSSTLGTLIGDLRSPSSDGGGHVQTASKGGTGHTSFIKGDLFVAQSGSTIAKLAVSSILGDVLTADTSTAVGMKWAGTTGSKVWLNTSSMMYRASSIETVIFAASVIGSTLGTSNGARFNIPITDFDLNNARTLVFKAKYGSNTLWTITLPQAPNNKTSLAGVLQGTVVAAGTDTTQRAFGTLFIAKPSYQNLQGSVFGGSGYGTASINSGITQEFIVTAQFTDGQETSSGFNVPFGEMDKIT